MLAMEQIDAVVIGAGVVGLAVGRALALSGREVLVLESENAIGTGTSSRNSEVIHAGIYYPAGSLKARLCVQGKQMLYAYCAERGVAHQQLGKLIVATSPEQVLALDGIRAKAAANGVHDLQKLTAAQAQALEPALACEAALLSPSTGVVDSHGLMLALQGDMENAGGLLALVSPVQHIGVRHGTATHPIRVTTEDGTEVACKVLVNAAGLHAVSLARSMDGLDPSQLPQALPQAYFAKGNYFTLAGRAPFSRLIYPVPEAAGLGVHLTLDLGGQAKFGPDVQWVDDPADLQVDPRRGDAFYAEVRKYWPALQDGALQPGYAGMRPKINAPHEAAADFMIQGPAEHGVPGLVNLLGIESPGLTSSLAIADEVCARLA
jgi:L-2-hydroxyglutarate oxidase LhgO